MKDRRRRCQSISRVVWPLSFTLWGIRYVSFSHEASHHGAASIRPLLCQVLSNLLCFCMLVCIILPLFSSCFLISLSFISSTCCFPSSHLFLQLCSASQRHPVILLISHSLVYFSFSSMIATPSFTSLFSPSLKKAGQRQQAKQNRTTAKKKKKELKKKHRSIRLLTV